MTYLDLINNDLTPNGSKESYLVYDLFAGCGGLALGFEAAGFKTRGFEMEEDPCKTYSKNLNGDCTQIFLKPGLDLGPRPDVIIGGPPCQPFSVRGLQNGKTDARNGFPAFLSLVENYEPKIAIFENVRGMFYRNKSYFEGVMASLESLHYIVDMKILNAVNFGVPQKRERLFVVAHRGEWKFPSPDPTSRLYTAGDAIGDIVDIGNGDLNRYVTPNMDAYISVYEKKSHCIRPRDLRFDEPSRTLTCRNLCGATSDMMRVRLSDGRRRRLTPREATRLQSFPDWFEFVGTESSQYNQIGNSVPPLLAKAVAKSTLDCLNGLSIDKSEIKKFKPNKQSAFALATSET